MQRAWSIAVSPFEAAILPSILLSIALVRKASLLIAFAVSLSLHLVVLIFLDRSTYSNAIPSGRPVSQARTTMIVTIEGTENPGLPVVAASNAPVPEAPKNPASRPVKQAVVNGALASPAIMYQEHYFSASELDVIPRIQQDIELYPEALQQFKQGGKVILRLWIDEAGQVEKVELVRSELPAIFAEVATRNFMQAGFMPGKRNNVAVKSKVEAVLVFPSHDSGNQNVAK